MINNQWYAVLSSHEVKKNKVLGVRRLGKDLVFFRSSNGELACVDHLFAHRKASLAKGWVQDDHIKCPFHGIEYDASGKCVYVPSDGRASKLDYERFHLTSYPVREIGGIVFLWHGEDKPTHEPDYFDVITDPSYAYDHVSDAWQVDYSRVIENQLDVSHLAFVHHNTIGRGGKMLCNGPKVEWLDDHTMRTSANNEKDVGQTPKPSQECEIKETNLTFKFPNMWLNHVTDKILILAYFVPVDEEHSMISLRFYNKITGFKPVDKAIAWLGSRANIIVERQDKRIVETQDPKKTWLKMDEKLAAADLPIMEYRRKRNALQGKESVKKAMPKILQEDAKAMYKLSYGLFVCTVLEDGKANGCIINTAMQTASKPNTISLSLNKANQTCDILARTGICNVSVLSTEASFALIQRFGFQSGRDIDKFDGFSGYAKADNGIPFLTEGTNAYFSLRVMEKIDLGSHILFLCQPLFMATISSIPSCTYAYYQENIKTKAVGKTSEGKTIWRCLVCGYEWAGEELPDDYICPICKHPKEDFEKISG